MFLKCYLNKNTEIHSKSAKGSVTEFPFKYLFSIHPKFLVEQLRLEISITSFFWKEDFYCK